MIGHEIDSLTEEAFARVIPERWRSVSATFWTPVEIAKRAACFLAPTTSARVLDVGSGIGKFCIVGARTTRATFWGIEHRAHLVDVARMASRRFRAHRAKFEVGTIDDVDWSLYDAFYFFNPFEENLLAADACLDRSVVLSEDRFWSDISFIECVFTRLPVGARLATFHGFCGRIPRTFELVDQQSHGTGALRFWTKVAPGGSCEEGLVEPLMARPTMPGNATS
jgi:hypothetical protein